MFKGCSSLSSIDLSNFITEKLTDNDKIFYGCSNLSYIDISSFNSKLKLNDLFDENIPLNGVLIVNEDILEIIRDYIPNNWTILT